MSTRYFFDTDDGTGQVRDGDGHDFGTLAEVRYAAIDALPDLAADKLPNGDRARFEVRVRDDVGRYIFEATLTFESQWLAAASAI